MENPEEILHSLEEFSKMKPKDIPKELEEYLKFVAKTGDPIYQWSAIKSLFREKFLNVITEFYESCTSMEIPPCPNVEMFNYDLMKSFILEKIDKFASAPFTLQRISELLTSPRKEYTRIDKYMRALEKNILVVSTMEAGGRRTENGESIMNGIETDHELVPEPANEINVEEMDDSPYIQTTNHVTVTEHMSVDIPTNSTHTEIDSTIETFSSEKINLEASTSSQEIVCAQYVSIESVSDNSQQSILLDTKMDDVSLTFVDDTVKEDDQKVLLDQTKADDISVTLVDVTVKDDNEKVILEDTKVESIPLSFIDVNVKDDNPKNILETTKVDIVPLTFSGIESGINVKDDSQTENPGDSKAEIFPLTFNDVNEEIPKIIDNVKADDEIKLLKETEADVVSSTVSLTFSDIIIKDDTQKKHLDDQAKDISLTLTTISVEDENQKTFLDERKADEISPSHVDVNVKDDNEKEFVEAKPDDVLPSASVPITITDSNVKDDNRKDILDETKADDVSSSVSLTFIDVNVKDEIQVSSPIAVQEDLHTEPILTEVIPKNSPEASSENINEPDSVTESDVNMETESVQSSEELSKSETTEISKEPVSEETPSTTVPDQPSEELDQP